MLCVCPFRASLPNKKKKVNKITILNMNNKNTFYKNKNTQPIKKQIKKEIIKDINNIVVRGKNKQKRKQQMFKPKQRMLHPYFDALLYPEFVRGIHVSKSSDPTVGVHRRVLLEKTANAAGNFAFVYSPSGLYETTFGTSSFADSTGTAYAGTYNSSFFNYQSLALNITPGACNNFRLVSCSVTVRPKNAVLTKQGTLILATVPFQAFIGGGNGGAVPFSCPAINDFLTVANLLNPTGGFSSTIDFSAGQCGRAIWLPKCTDETEDSTPINSNEASAVSGFNNGYGFVGIVTNAGNAAGIEIEINVNYELIPSATSVLLGMESISTDFIDPLSVAHYIKCYMGTSITQAMTSNSNSAFAEMLGLQRATVNVQKVNGLDLYK
jgi:hypothetical protein